MIWVDGRDLQRAARKTIKRNEKKGRKKSEQSQNKYDKTALKRVCQKR